MVSNQHTNHGNHDPETEVQLSYYASRAKAIETLLVEKGVMTTAEIDREVNAMDSKSPADGAKIVALAWSDESFKTRLLANASDALKEIGYELPDKTPYLKVVENSDSIHHVVVCTLCSCYPRMLLGRPPDWYKSLAYRSRVVVSPREVMEEFGLRLSDDVEVRVLDSTADMRYMVIPRRPSGTEALDQESLAALVTRDSMIGVSDPLSADRL